MAKVLSLDSNGNTTEIQGTSVSAGSADVGKLLQLGADGKVDTSVLPNGVAADAISLVASEAIAAGAFVNETSDGKVRNASNAGIGTRAIGYTNAAIASGATGTIFYDDTNSSLSGLTPGTMYFLGTAGQVTTTVTTTSGQIHQKLGIAATTTSIHVNIQEPIIRA